MRIDFGPGYDQLFVLNSLKIHKLQGSQMVRFNLQGLRDMRGMVWARDRELKTIPSGPRSAACIMYMVISIFLDLNFFVQFDHKCI